MPQRTRSSNAGGGRVAPAGACRFVYAGFFIHLLSAGSPQGRIAFVSSRKVVRLPLLLTPPHGDATTVDYRPKSACLKWTSTTPIAHTCGRTVSRAQPCGSPKVDLQKMSDCFRQRVIAFFLERELLNERLAKNMIHWTHSAFSVDASIRIPAGWYA